MFLAILLGGGFGALILTWIITGKIKKWLGIKTYAEQQAEDLLNKDDKSFNE